MLKLLRKKGFAKKVIWFVAIVIIISFGFLGTAYLLSDRATATYAGKIFGKTISFNDFDGYYQHTRVQAIIRYGDEFRNVREFLNLQTETWDRLILLHEAKRRKIAISDQLVAQTIEQYPFFQRDDQFDTLLYNDILRFIFRIKPRDFEESIRDTLKIKALYDQETASIEVDELEIQNAFKKLNEKVQISYVLIAPEKYTDQVIYKEDEAKEFYQRNQPAFLNPPSINVEFISLDFPEGENADREPVYKQANAIYQDLLVNPNIQEIAEKHSVKAQESGFFSVEKPNLSLGWSYENLNSIFQLQENDIEEPFEVPDGLRIIKIKERKEAFIPEFAEIREKVVEGLLKEKAKVIAKEKSKEFLNTIIEKHADSQTKDFVQIAKDLGLEILKTPVFGRGEYLPKVGIAVDFQQAAFALDELNTISDVVETEVGYCILHLDDTIPADQDKYASQKEEIAKAMLDERKNQAFNEFITQLRLKANLEDNISKLQEQNQ